MTENVAANSAEPNHADCLILHGLMSLSKIKDMSRRKEREKDRKNAEEAWQRDESGQCIYNTTLLLQAILKQGFVKPESMSLLLR